MAISAKLKTFLDGAKIKYTPAKHPVVYTAQEIAAAQHVPGRQLAKCVLIKTDRGPVLAVLPAVYRVDLKRVKSAAGAKSASIAKESDIKHHFPDIEVGAMSPFGNLYGVPVIVEKELGNAKDVVFNAGSHTDTIKMAYQDVIKLTKPKLGGFALTAEGKPIPKKKAALSGQHQGSKSRGKPGKKARKAKPAKKRGR
jgi:Ala-tRNA(Pro) deacylase